MSKIKYVLYCAKCVVCNESPWDYVTWLSNTLFVKGWR